MSTHDSDQEGLFAGFSEEEVNCTMVDTELPHAKAEQSRLLRCLERLEDFAKGSGEITAEQANVRVKRLEKFWEDFQAISSRIIRLDLPENADKNESLYDEVDERVLELSGKLQLHAVKPEKEEKKESIIMKPQKVNPNLRLPKISLPEFTGKYDAWMQFHDLFVVMIHNDTVLSNIEKFYYLKGSLKGEALKVVEAFPVSAGSYEAAWSALIKRYANPYLQKKRHTNDLLNWPRLKKQSISGINELIDGFERHTKMLQQLGETPAQWGIMLIQLLVSKLDDKTQREWERVVEKKDDATFEELIEVLRAQVRILEALGENKHEHQTNQPSANKQKVAVHIAAQDQVVKCVMCDENHQVAKCEEFAKLSVNDRFALVRAKGLCVNCLRGGHFKGQCVSRIRCRACNSKHNSLLHAWTPKRRPLSSADVTKEAADSFSASVVDRVPVENTSLSAVTHIPTIPVGRLSTAVVKIKGLGGDFKLARAMLDSGSQLNIISSRLSRDLGLHLRPSNVKLIGIGRCEVKSNKAVTAEVHSQNTNYAQTMQFVVMDNITSAVLPVEQSHLNYLPSGFVLADAGLENSGEVDVLLGAECFYEFLQIDGPKTVKDKAGNTMFVNTVFGWIAIGQRLPVEAPALCSQLSLEEQIERFWRMEEILPETTLTQEEKDCEKHFQESHARDETGRYIVKLPMRANGEKMIGESFEMAKRRFLQLERRLMKDNDLYGSYREVIRKYLDLQYLEEIPFQKDNMIDSSSCIKACYIPHHPVIKQSSSSTKVRPVFDGSAKTSTGFSLNDSLLVGPVIQDTLFNLVLRFRSNEVALVADIEKMYLQVKVHHDDTPLQRIIWRFNKDDELKVYELKRVTFGLAPSSFLATRVLSQLAADEGLRYPAGQKALQESFYVDDFLGGTNDKVKASELVRELVELLQKGGFCLKKWSSNVPEVLNELPSIDKAETSVVGLGPAEFVKTLGLCWYPATDELSIVVNTNGSPMQLTKRVIYSFIAKLFDPLGLIGPIIIWAKIRMQHLWIIKCDWDDPLPLDVTKKWNIFLEQLPHIDRIRVIRHVFVSKEASIQLHCFCDASEAAYGACIYARSRSSDDVVVVRLLASKSKPAPLKRVSLPRLELCAAVLGARLFRKVGSGLKMEISDAFFWSDSAIVLHWLKSPSYSWSTYVANRVSEIQDTTKEYRWLHIKGSENPADAISRGLLPEELAKSRLWFEGPEWLIEPMDKWKCQLNTDLPAEEDLERRRTVLTVAPTEVVFPLLERYSSFWKTIRIAAYCIRFSRRCQRKSTENGNIANGEFRRALKVLVKSLQSFEFAEEISDLRKGKSISSRSRLKLLRPFLDDEGVLRVGGRLSQIEMKYSAKHPMIVPAKHHFTRLMAKSFHEMTLHSGPRLTLATMRQEIWPLHGKALANYICRSCHQCFKVNPSPIQQPIGQLPALRAKSIKPFSVVGVDFCGPVHLKPVHRKAAAVKTYIAIYVCFSTKAVHIELASYLSTQAFLATFHRFIARRGLPTDIYSDNGLNFRGASNNLQEIGRLLEDPQTQSEICSDALKRNEEWHFIPPRAPNFGGLWEAAVKVAKRTLYKILGTRQLSFGDMTTVLTQIEAQMNSRPLTPLSDDPRELDVLTPGHFLIGSSMLTFLEPDFAATPCNRLKHYQQLQQLVQQHWQRWRKEYLCELHNVYQNQGKLHNIRLGEMVILKEDHKIMNEWFLGRIVGLHPGKDSVVRVVSVQTQRGVYKRPVSRICPLPFEREVKTLNENH